MLRLLLTVVLSVGLSWGLMAWVESGITCSLSRHDGVRPELSSIKLMLEMQALASKSGAIPPGYLPGNDPWRHPYQWSESKSPDHTIPDFQVYSLGEDGASASKGNDPDDINSWDDHHHEFYAQEAKRDRLRGYLLIVLMNSIPAFFAIHAIEIGWRKIRHRSSSP